MARIRGGMLAWTVEAAAVFALEASSGSISGLSRGTCKVEVL